MSEPGSIYDLPSRRSLADQVADALVQLILKEGLQDGDQLPSTAELSDRFRVSRTVIREALAALAGQGILSRSQGRESVVATPGRERLANLLQFRVRRDDVEPLDTLEVRVALEVVAARRAARRRDDAHLGRLRQCLERLATAKTESAYHRADIAFHRAVAEASGNALTVLVLDALVELLHDVRVRATRNRRARGEPLDEMVRQHARILEAIEAGDGEAAAAAMARHLESTAAELDRQAAKDR